MSKRKIIYVVLAVVGIIFILVFTKGCSVNNNCIEKENKIVASDENLTAVISSKDNILDGKSQAVKKYSDDVIKAIDIAMTKRYGDGGSEAAMQWIQEQNPTMDAAIYRELSDAVEIYFTNIEMANRQIVDDVRNYKNYYQVFPNSMFASMFGFPKINLEHYGKAVVSKNARDESNTRESSELDLFKE